MEEKEKARDKNPVETIAKTIIEKEKKNSLFELLKYVQFNFIFNSKKEQKTDMWVFTNAKTTEIERRRFSGKRARSR